MEMVSHAAGGDFVHWKGERMINGTGLLSVLLGSDRKKDENSLKKTTSQTASLTSRVQS